MSSNDYSWYIRCIITLYTIPVCISHLQCCCCFRLLIGWLDIGQILCEKLLRNLYYELSRWLLRVEIDVRGTYGETVWMSFKEGADGNVWSKISIEALWIYHLFCSYFFTVRIKCHDPWQTACTVHDFGFVLPRVSRKEDTDLEQGQE